MTDGLAKDLANAARALVVAPAGCGKTHLISESVRLCNARQLILTHTHAGVKAIRDRMVRLKVSDDQYRISTLDAFALRYASAFPTLSGWHVREPTGEQWQQLRPAATKVMRTQVVDAVLRASYTGVFVDEYQDCSTDQHELVATLASVLPCRVLGDPLQSVFTQVHKQYALAWSQVKAAFPLIGELRHPYRWDNQNERLGCWLLELRDALLTGGEIDLRTASCIDFRQCDPGRQAVAACLEKLSAMNESVVALREKREQCQYLAGNLGNRYSVFEDAQCEDLISWASKIDDSRGIDRIKSVVQFAERWLTRLPCSAIAPVVKAVLKQQRPRARRPDLLRLAAGLAKIRDGTDANAIVEVLRAFSALDEKPVFKSREVWTGLERAALSCSFDANQSLREAAWQHRDSIRRYGRRPPHRCLSTPLLVKGLEFDHSIILNAADFPDAERLYVSLTRASKSATVLSRSPILAARRCAV